MALPSNLTLTEVKQSVASGSTVSGQVVNLTLTPDTGYALSAEFFKPNGSGTSEAIANYGTSSATWTFTPSGDNFAAETDALITQIVFSDNGEPGDANNTVNIAVTVGSFSMPTSAKEISVDIDTDTGAVVLLSARDYSFDVVYNDQTGHTITQTAGTGLAAGTAVTHGGDYERKRFTGSITADNENLIATFAFAASSGNHYSAPGPYINIKAKGFEKSYKQVATDTVDSSNRITARTIKVFFNPGSEVVWPKNSESLEHKLFLTH